MNTKTKKAFLTLISPRGTLESTKVMCGDVEVAVFAINAPPKAPKQKTPTLHDLVVEAINNSTYVLSKVYLGRKQQKALKESAHYLNSSYINSPARICGLTVVDVNMEDNLSFS